MIDMTCVAFAFFTFVCGTAFGGIIGRMLEAHDWRDNAKRDVSRWSNGHFYIVRREGTMSIYDEGDDSGH